MKNKSLTIFAVLFAALSLLGANCNSIDYSATLSGTITIANGCSVPMSSITSGIPINVSSDLVLSGGSTLTISTTSAVQFRLDASGNLVGSYTISISRHNDPLSNRDYWTNLRLGKQCKDLFNCVSVSQPTCSTSTPAYRGMDYLTQAVSDTSSSSSIRFQNTRNFEIRCSCNTSAGS